MAHGYDESGAAGLDLKWHVTQDLTLDAAVMPDFAQVEADQLILNLTNVETFLPEKRALFLEGAEAFATPLQVFYSRRIGNAPTNPTLRSDLIDRPMTDTTETLVEVPETALIYGAAKLVGNLNSHWTVGALSAFTAPNQVAVQESTNQVPTCNDRRVAQPAMSFNVLRLKRELGRNAYLGVIGTGATVLDEQTLGYPPSIRADERPTVQSLCPSGAQVMPGVALLPRRLPGRHRRVLAFGVGQLHGRRAGRRVADRERAAAPTRRPRCSTAPRSARATMLRAAGSASRRRAASRSSGPPSTPTRARSSTTTTSGSSCARTCTSSRPASAIARWTPGNYTIDTTTLLELDVRRSLAGLDLGDTLELNTRWHLRRFWTVFLAADASRSHYDDREVGDGTALERAEWLGAKFEVFSDPRRKIAGSLANQTQFMRGGVNTLLQGSLLLHLIPPLEIEILPQLTYTRGEPRFAWNGGAADATPSSTSGDIFGDLTAKSAGGTLRASYAFTPTLTLQTYAQLFLASGHYTNLKQVAPRSPTRISLRVSLDMAAARRRTR